MWLGGAEWRWGGGGGVAGARGNTLGDAAIAPGALDTAELAADDAGTELAGCRTGGGGGDERKAPGNPPRAEGGGGIRELSAPLPDGRGTTLTGRGATLAGGAAEVATSSEATALGSLSSPIENGWRTPARARLRLYPKLRYSRTIS